MYYLKTSLTPILHFAFWRVLFGAYTMSRLLTLTLLTLLPTLALAMSNPAAENCKKQGLGYVLDNSTGYCVFPDGSRCEEWAYFRHQCSAAAPDGDDDKDDVVIDNDTDEVDDPMPNQNLGSSKPLQNAAPND
jgi:hypothetical protein